MRLGPCPKIVPLSTAERPVVGSRGRGAVWLLAAIASGLFHAGLFAVLLSDGFWHADLPPPEPTIVVELIVEEAVEPELPEPEVPESEGAELEVAEVEPLEPEPVEPEPAEPEIAEVEPPEPEPVEAEPFEPEISEAEALAPEPPLLDAPPPLPLPPRKPVLAEPEVPPEVVEPTELAEAPPELPVEAAVDPPVEPAPEAPVETIAESDYLNRDDIEEVSAEGLLANIAALQDEDAQARRNPELWEVIRAVRAQIARCWAVEPDLAVSSKFSVDIDVAFGQDGSVTRTRIQEVARMVNDDDYKHFVLDTRQSLMACSPFDLPADKFEIWRQFTMRFLPKGPV